MSKTLILFRGIPGSGKSTLAGLLVPDANIAADDYWDKYHEGEFIPQKLFLAHKWCLAETARMMEYELRTIAVHNTFTTESEMQGYIDAAETNGYQVHTVIVENRHGNESVHNVPDATLDKMRNRFGVKL